MYLGYDQGGKERMSDMGTLNKLRGPFDDRSVKNFLEGMRSGEVGHLYREGTASGEKVPNHLGWLWKQADDQFAVSTPRGTLISGDELKTYEAVETILEPNPEYIIHDA